MMRPSPDFGRPDAAAPLDPDHWLAGRLLHLIAAREGTGPATEAVQGVSLAPVGGAAWAPDGSGLVTAASQYWNAASGGVDWPLPVTLWWRGVLGGTPQNNADFLGRRPSGGFDYALDVQTGSIGFVWGGVLSFAGLHLAPPAAGVEFLAAVCLDASSQVGYLATAGGGASGSLANTLSGSPGASAPLTLGVDANAASSRYVPGTTFQAGAASGLLTADQVADLWADPWGMFAPPPWLVAATAGSAAPAAPRFRRGLTLRTGSRGVA